MVEKIHESEYGNGRNNFHITRSDNTLSVELTYPPYTDAHNVNGQVRYVVFDQESVRATDGIRIHFDFQRNGYVIEQASRFAWNTDDPICDPDWQEVAFIEAWSRAESEDEENLRLYGGA